MLMNFRWEKNLLYKQNQSILNQMSIPHSSTFTYQNRQSQPYTYQQPHYTSQMSSNPPNQIAHSTVRPVTITQPNVQQTFQTNQYPLENRPQTLIYQAFPERQATVIHEQHQQIIQPKIIQEHRIIRSRVDEGRRDTEAHRAYDQEPVVQTVRTSDKNYYSSYQYHERPPRAASEERETKTCCSPWLLALLGLLALAGLITAIVLAAKVNSGIDVDEDITKEGISTQQVISNSDEATPSNQLLENGQEQGNTITIQTQILNKTKTAEPIQKDETTLEDGKQNQIAPAPETNLNQDGKATEGEKDQNDGVVEESQHHLKVHRII